MPHLTNPCLATATMAAMILFAAPAQAATINVNYNLSGTGDVQGATATTLSLAATAGGSLLSGNAVLDAAWNPVAYSDTAVLDFTTNLLNGTFTMTLADGDKLFGTVFEDQTIADSSPTGTGAFPQILTLTGGTGAFSGATGSLSGQGFLGETSFTVSGSGTINTAAIPEPASATLLLCGIGLLGVKQGFNRRKV